MNVLVIDTAREMLAVYVIKGEEVFSYIDEEKKNGHSETLLNGINVVLSRAGITLDEIDYFSADIGPGSFTGIRIGVCTANAFAYVKNKKTVPFSVFEPFANGNKTVALDAKHGNYYFMKTVNGEKEFGFCSENELGEDVVFVSGLYDTENLKKAVLENLKDRSDFLVPLYVKLSEAEINEKR